MEEEKKVVSDADHCNKCDKMYNGINKIKFTCPA